jgi:mycoredoxin
MPHTPDAPVTLYATARCGYCRRLKRAMDQAGIGYREVDVERDAEAAELVEYINGGYRLVPTLVFADEEVLVNPTVDEVRAQLASMSPTPSVAPGR